MSSAGHTSIFEGLSSVGTFAVAIFAAASAWAARESAKATQATVDEARLARRDEIMPRFVVEKNFLDFAFFWPHPATLNGEPVFLARKHWKDADPTPPTFTVSNFGQSPALELTVTFELIDHNGSLAVPDAYKAIGITDGLPAHSLRDDAPAIPVIQFASAGRSNGLGLYRLQTVSLPNCVPGQPRIVPFPEGLLSRLLLRGIQNGAAWDESRHMVLIVKIEAYTVDGELVGTQFRYKISPFCYGATVPLDVRGHCWELPTFPVPCGPRAAV